MLRAAQGRAAGAGARAVPRLGHRACAATTPRRARDIPSSAGTRGGDGQDQPARGRLDAGRRRRLRRGARRRSRTRCCRPATPRSAARPAPAPWRPARTPARAAGRDGQDRVRAARDERDLRGVDRAADDAAGPLESEAIHILREVAGEFERPVLLFSGGKDSIVMLHLARQGVLAGGRCRSRCCTSTPVTTSPRSSTSATAWPPSAGCGCSSPPCRTSIDDGRVRRASRRHAATRCRRSRCSTPSTRAPVRRRLRRRPPRRGEGPRQGAGVLACATSSASGTRAGSGPSCGTSTTAGTGRASTSACSRSPTGPSWTSGATSTASASSCPEIYFAHEREVFRRDGMWLRSRRLGRRRAGEDTRDAHRPLPHRRRHELHGRRRVGRRHGAGGRSPRSPRRASPSAARPAPTTAPSEAAMEDRKREGYF